jgi:hypothetical protein
MKATERNIIKLFSSMALKVMISYNDIVENSLIEEDGKFLTFN